MVLEEIGCEVVNWIKVAYDCSQWCAVVDIEMNFRVLERIWHFVTSWAGLSLLRRLVVGLSSRKPRFDAGKGLLSTECTGADFLPILIPPSVPYSLMTL
jgi:hypothetical protein